MYWVSEWKLLIVSNSLRPHGLYIPWNSLGQNTGVVSISLLQRIFPTQGWNPGLPHCRWILSQLSHKGSPSILEWVAYPFSSRSSRPRNWAGVSCISGRLLPAELSGHQWLISSRKCWAEKHGQGRNELGVISVLGHHQGLYRQDGFKGSKMGVPEQE